MPRVDTLLGLGVRDFCPARYSNGGAGRLKRPTCNGKGALPAWAVGLLLGFYSSSTYESSRLRPVHAIRPACSNQASSSYRVGLLRILLLVFDLKLKPLEPSAFETCPFLAQVEASEPFWRLAPPNSVSLARLWAQNQQRAETWGLFPILFNHRSFQEPGVSLGV